MYVNILEYQLIFIIKFVAIVFFPPRYRKHECGFFLFRIKLFFIIRTSVMKLGRLFPRRKMKHMVFKT